MTIFKKCLSNIMVPTLHFLPSKEKSYKNMIWRKYAARGFVWTLTPPHSVKCGKRVEAKKNGNGKSGEGQYGFNSEDIPLWHSQYKYAFFRHLFFNGGIGCNDRPLHFNLHFVHFFLFAKYVLSRGGCFFVNIIE